MLLAKLEYTLLREEQTWMKISEQLSLQKVLQSVFFRPRTVESCEETLFLFSYNNIYNKNPLLLKKEKHVTNKTSKMSEKNY